MYEIYLENENQEIIEFNKPGGDFTISEIDGLYPSTAIINTDTTALLDGSRFNSSKVAAKEILFAFAIEKNAAENRVKIYRVIQPKKPITLYYKSETRDVFISGYVEELSISHFAMKQIATMRMLCPFPFFKAAQETINQIRNIKPRFHFPFASTEEPELLMGEIDVVSSITIENDGAMETGLTFELYATGEIVNPKIYNYITREFFGLDFTMQAGDLITINTSQGNKTVKLLRSAQIINIFNYVENGSTWLQLPSAGGVFIYTIEAGQQTNLEITIRHFNTYEGV